MFFYIKKNAYSKDGVRKCFVSLYDSNSDDILSCGAASSLSAEGLESLCSTLSFAEPVNVELAFSTFNGNVRPQIVSISKNGGK